MTETLEESMHVPLTLGSKQHNTHAHAHAHIVTQTYIGTLNNTGKMVPWTPSSPPHHLNQISPSPLIDSVPSATMKVFIGSKGSWWHAHLDNFKALSFIFNYSLEIGFLFLHFRHYRKAFLTLTLLMLRSMNIMRWVIKIHGTLSVCSPAFFSLCSCCKCNSAFLSPFLSILLYLSLTVTLHCYVHFSWSCFIFSSHCNSLHALLSPVIASRTHRS